jgi:hypothetical protein
VQPQVPNPQSGPEGVRKSENGGANNGEDFGGTFILSLRFMGFLLANGPEV